MLRRICQAVVALTWIVLAADAAYAQGSIVGIVRDTSGAVLPGVTVEAASPALIEKVRSVVTDATGQFQIVSLQAGAVFGLLSTTESRCWLAYSRAGGGYEYRIVPELESSPIMGGPGQPVASGCGGSTVTYAGIGLAAVFAAGAVAIAAATASPGRPRRALGTADG